MKKLLPLALALCMALVLLPGTALAAETSGACGDGVTWSLSDGTLTISGTGTMRNYSPKSLWRANVPWDSQRSAITAVVIGDGVTSIGDYAFYCSENLTSVTISDSVTAIGRDAFAWCEKLTSATIPNSVISIGWWAFDGCQNLTSVTIPDGITTIEKGVFAECRSLTSVTIPDSVTSIGLQAFYSCQSLTNVTIPNSVTSIGEQAFYLCESLTSVTIPDSVTSIGISAFSQCDSLISVTIPTSVTSIPQSAFGGDSLKDVYYGGSESQWKQIPVERGNDLLLAATFHYNSTGPGTSTTTSIPATPASPTKFTDVSPSSPFVDAINWAVEKNITTGKTDTTFAPGEECTNGQILTFLWRANGSPEPTVDNPFTDSIPASFQKAAVWAYEKGLVSGAVFGASTPCTRAVTVEYLWKVAGSPTTSENTSFADVSANADYAQAVAWAVENGVTSGTGNGQFSPDNTCTRGQIVTFLYRAMGK